MSSVGFKDFSRARVTGGMELLALNEVISGTVTSAGFYASDYGYLILAYNTLSLAGFYSAQIYWYTDDTYSTLLVQQRMVCTPNAQGALAVPVITPWCKLYVNNVSGTSEGAVQISVYGSNAYPGLMGTGTGFSLLAVWDSAVAAAGTETVNTSSTHHGPAVLSVSAVTSASWTVKVEYYDADTSGWRILNLLSGSVYGRETTQELILPPFPVRVIVENDATASQTIYMSLTG